MKEHLTTTKHLGTTMYECNYCDYYSHYIDVTKEHIVLRHQDKLKKENGDI